MMDLICKDFPEIGKTDMHNGNIDYSYNGGKCAGFDWLRSPYFVNEIGAINTKPISDNDKEIIKPFKYDGRSIGYIPISKNYLVNKYWEAGIKVGL